MEYARRLAPDDVADRKILRALALDSRISLRDLGVQVGLSAPAVRERINRMEDEGVIEGFSIRIDPAALGYTLEAFVRIEPLPGKLKQIEKALQNIPEVTECSVVTGEDCFVARVVLREINDLNRLLDPLHDKARTNTSIVKSMPVRRRLPPL
ncbi:Lrp/AsnC family transcriptional regulator [Paralcaligenes ureilyticus]|uniref:AsnC family transcriptional regulator n=1 Tax=Paralcaligenes ureilyticus TaxID=627131 RepID=A0A4R3M0U7_9BURK|nr:Lrp/AsnC family transcriptional regulator [Paralcaligenes ureilyticus]TCT06343.1 AsnC family transcriptional regulator [Paralcaligenes ureilyticus]